MASDLPWVDVEPRTRPFDGTAVRAAIAQVVGDYASTFGGDPLRGQIEDAIDHAIVQTLGPWASGWRWSASEPGGGGPVRGWCCGLHSVFRAGDRDPGVTVDRAVDAVVEWRMVLVSLDTMFTMLRAETASLPVAKEIELAASRLLPFVVERTGAEDAWYGTFACMLTWYLQAAGIADPSTAELVSDAIAGRFSSWTAPDPPAGRAICEELGEVLGGRIGDGELRDALADWRLVRERPIRVVPLDRTPVVRDGHEAYILEHDRARDPDRAERMAAALRRCRDAAVRGMPLAFDLLAAWQGVVLGAAGPVAFRTTDAFAKQGRECYRYSPDLRDHFECALAEASGPALSVAVRAARVYLDVCFFHPFADGNARAARLALDHVLTSAGLALRTAEPVFALARGADDPAGLWSLAFVIERSLGTRSLV